MKRTGLADSPFFRPVQSPAPPEHEAATTLPATPVPVFSSVQTNERTDEHLNIRTVEQVNERTLEQAILRSDERTNERTAERFEEPPRHISRKSYDLFDDQAEAIDDLAYRWSRQRKKHITKGQVIRELLDEILLAKLK